MRNLSIILLIFYVFKSYSQVNQYVSLCPDSQSNFTYYIPNNTYPLSWTYNNQGETGTNLQINWTEPGEYIIKAEYNFACNVIKKIYKVQVDGCYTTNIYFPNSFTPNADGLNDSFAAKGENVTEFNLLIYNRWGELLFESNDINIGWDGTSKQNREPVQDDVYVYSAKWFDIRKKWKSQIGKVILIR